LDFYLLSQQEMTFNGTFLRDILASVISRLGGICMELNQQKKEEKKQTKNILSVF